MVDVHLGKLAKYLRILGFDTLYKNNYTTTEILQISKLQKRIILTKSIALLKNKSVERGYWIRAKKLIEQLTEILTRFDLFKSIKPFTRCIVCNGIIKSISKNSVVEKLPPKTKQFYDKFCQCQSCKKIYWQGSHYQRMINFLEQFYKIQYRKSVRSGIDNIQP